MFLWLKRIFEKVKFKKEKSTYNEVDNYFIYENDHTSIIHDACKICYDKPPEEDYDSKMDYISRRIKSGHESVLEHSNFVNVYTMNPSVISELAEVLTVCRFLNTKVKYKNGAVYLFIGGSIRGYKEIFRRIENQENVVAKSILNSMYDLDNRYFGDFINNKIMNINSFGAASNEFRDEGENKKYEGKYFEIINIDYINDNEFTSLLSKDDLLDLRTITIRFKDISRIISQMYLRHRDGVTQESQRYVDYSGAKFNPPYLFKDKYSKDAKFTIANLINPRTNTNEFTMDQLGDLLLSIYPQLREQGLDREDARGYLPNNTTTQFYMTFTIRNLIYFLYLRTPLAAQAEIRLNALEIEAILKEVLGEDDIYKYITPEFIKIQEAANEVYDSIDEVISEDTINE